MGREGTFWLPPQGSTTAGEIDALFYFIYWVSVIILAGVTIFMVYFAWKYRRRSAADRPQEVRESKALELSWVVIPSLLVLVVFWWGMQAFISAGIPPANAYQIHVTGKKWLWDFEYPNGTRSTGDLVVPVNEPIELVMTSEDVIHSFFIPAFRQKMDVLPNRYTSLWFEAVEADTFQVFCTEYCGTAHSEMYARVIALERGAFNEWLASGGGGGEDVPLPELGEQLYTRQACNNCHTTDGSPSIGPSWVGFWGETRPLEGGGSVLYDADYVRESIVNPNAKIAQGYPPVMPPYPNLSNRELAGLIAYIQDLNGAWTGEEDLLSADGEGEDADAADGTAAEEPAAAAAEEE